MCYPEQFQRGRNNRNLFPPNPLRLKDLAIPNELRFITFLGKEHIFLLHDSYDSDRLESERFLLFSTETLINTLNNYRNWYADKTFDSSPKINIYLVYLPYYLQKQKLFI